MIPAISRHGHATTRLHYSQLNHVIPPILAQNLNPYPIVPHMNPMSDTIDCRLTTAYFLFPSSSLRHQLSQIPLSRPHSPQPLSLSLLPNLTPLSHRYKYTAYTKEIRSTTKNKTAPPPPSPPPSPPQTVQHTTSSPTSHGATYS